MPRLSIVIPCYQSAQELATTLPALYALEGQYPAGITPEYILVDDGSTDATWQVIAQAHTARPDAVQGVRLSGNFGAYNAVLAGLAHASGEATVVISADLQDPPELILQLLAPWQQGMKLVIGQRTGRKDPWLSRLLATTAQGIIRRWALPGLPRGGFDCVLFDRALRERLVALNERNAHQLYLLLTLGYPYAVVPYQRGPRKQARSRWSLRRRLKLLLDALVGFGYAPIRAISAMGLLLGLGALGYGGFILWAKASGRIPIEGWTSTMLVLLFVSAFQMTALGILGEYLWRTLDAVRQRPNYVVAEVVLG